MRPDDRRDPGDRRRVVEVATHGHVGEEEVMLKRATPACRHRPRAIRGGGRCVRRAGSRPRCGRRRTPFRCRGGERLSPTGPADRAICERAAAAAVSRRCRSTVNRWYGLRCGRARTGAHSGGAWSTGRVGQGFDDLDGCRPAIRKVHEELAPFMRPFVGRLHGDGGEPLQRLAGDEGVMGCRCRRRRAAGASGRGRRASGPSTTSSSRSSTPSPSSAVRRLTRPNGPRSAERIRRQVSSLVQAESTALLGRLVP